MWCTNIEIMKKMITEHSEKLQKPAWHCRPFITYHIGRYRRMDNETKMMLNAILEEMGGMEDRMNQRMDENFAAVDRRFNKIDFQLEAMRDGAA